MKEETFLKKIGPQYALTNQAMELVKNDLEYGLSQEEIESYLMEPGEEAMKFYSQCLRDGMSETMLHGLTKNGLTITQKNVLYDFWEKGVPEEIICQVADEKEKAHVMKKKLDEVFRTQSGEKEICDLLKAILERLDMQSAGAGKEEMKQKELKEIRKELEHLSKENKEKKMDIPANSLSENQNTVPSNSFTPTIQKQTPSAYQKNLVAKVFEKGIGRSSQKQLFPLLIKKKLEPDQICEIKKGYIQGLTEDQLCDMIHAHLSAAKMAEIIEVAVLVNRKEKE